MHRVKDSPPLGLCVVESNDVCTFSVEVEYDLSEPQVRLL